MSRNRGSASAHTPGVLVAVQSYVDHERVDKNDKSSRSQIIPAVRDEIDRPPAEDVGSGTSVMHEVQNEPVVLMSYDELIEVGLPIVRRLAYRLARRVPPSIDVGDLISAGTEGLLKAINGFDPNRACRFQSYAEVRIRGAILDQLRSVDPMTRHGRKRLTEVSKTIRNLEAELGRSPDQEEISKALGISLSAYQKLTEGFASAPTLQKVGEFDPDHVASNVEDPAACLRKKELQRDLADAIRGLPPRNQKVLALYYQEECTQAEIGKILGVTESRVCQILGESVVRLRGALQEGS